MACGGACEKQIYHFEQGLGATVVHKGTGHPYLSYAEFNEVLKNYFKLAYPEIWLKKCAKGCECVPFFWHVLLPDPFFQPNHTSRVGIFAPQNRRFMCFF